MFNYFLGVVATCEPFPFLSLISLELLPWLLTKRKNHSSEKCADFDKGAENSMRGKPTELPEIKAKKVRLNVYTHILFSFHYLQVGRVALEAIYIHDVQQYNRLSFHRCLVTL